MKVFLYIVGFPLSFLCTINAAIPVFKYDRINIVIASDRVIPRNSNSFYLGYWVFFMYVIVSAKKKTPAIISKINQMLRTRLTLNTGLKSSPIIIKKILAFCNLGLFKNKKIDAEKMKTLRN